MEPTQPSAAFLALQQQLEQSQALAAATNQSSAAPNGPKAPKAKKPKGQGPKQPRNPKRASNAPSAGAPSAAPSNGGPAAPPQKPKKKKADRSTGKSSASADQKSQLAASSQAAQVAVSSNTRDSINLQQLRRYDADVEAVLLNCTFTVLYELSSVGNQSLWQKKPFEGPMFLVRRSSAPYHRIVILNRVNPENFLFSLDENVQWEQKDCYIFFQDPAVDVVRGLWFSYESEAQRAAAALNQAVSEVAAPAASASGAVTPNRHDSDRKHFFGLLSRAGIMPQPPASASSGTLPPVVSRTVSGTGLPASDNHGIALLQMLQGTQAQSPDAAAESKADLPTVLSLSDLERGLARKKNATTEDPSAQATAKTQMPTGGSAAPVQRAPSLSSIPVGSPSGGPNSTLLMPSALLLASEKPPAPLKPLSIPTSLPSSQSAAPSSPATGVTTVTASALVSSAIPSSVASASLLQLLKPTNITATSSTAPSLAAQPTSSASTASSAAGPLGSPVPRLTPAELLRGTSVSSTASTATTTASTTSASQVPGLLKPRLLLSASPPPSGPSSVGDAVSLTSMPPAEMVTVHFTNKPPVDASVVGVSQAATHIRADSNGSSVPSSTATGAGPALPDVRPESDRSPSLTKQGFREVLEKITQDESLLDLVYQRYLKHDISGAVFESL